MKLITYEQYESYNTVNNEIDLNLLEEPVKNYYMELYSIYMSFFLQYIIKNTNLKNFDNAILKSGLNFKKIDESEMDIYQYLSSDFLDFFYIRNNIYIYRLTDLERDFLKNRLLTKNFKYDNEIEDFIKNTYRKIIFENVKENEKVLIDYSENNQGFFAPNTSLVLGFRYDKYNNGLEDKKWYDNYQRQLNFMYKLIKKLLKDINKKMFEDCYIFEFDENSKKKTMINSVGANKVS